ncbi:MAG: DUF4349 domain-containing protein [Cyclobacteriaceae bacterium]|nr:DUF4349 domain-containing protein [Cyclobacteriaceae bacterium]
MKIHLLLFATLFIFSCSKDKSRLELAPSGEQQSSMNEALSSAPNVSVERKLIKNGDLSFKTDDTKKTKAEIEKIVKEFNGYISTESQNNYGDRLQYSQIIRVPSARFEELIQKIEAIAEEVESRNISSQDVTEEFIDTEARVKTKKELEARYREILKEAKTVADILAIEAQIGAVRTEIESAEGRLNYLKSQVSFSTLNVTYYKTIGTDFGFASRFVDSLGYGWNNLLTFIIGLAMLWPFMIMIIVGGWWWFRRKKKS